MTTGQKWGLAAIVGGLALAGTGVVLAVTSRKRRGGSDYAFALAGDHVSRHRRGGMQLDHYRGKMPIERRIKLLQDLVWEGVRDPEMRKLALGITNKCPARDGLCETRAIYDWVRTNVRYTGDVAPIKHGANGPVEGIDFFSTAKRTIELGGEDCDGHSVLTATLLALNGITPRFRITGRSANKRLDDFSHIYPLAGLPKLTPSKWIALDSTVPGDFFGKEAPAGKSRDFPA